MKITSINYNIASSDYSEMVATNNSNCESLNEEIRKYLFATIYKACVKYLKMNNNFSNKFALAKNYAEIASQEVEIGSSSYEISKFDAKSGNAEIIFF